MFSFLCFIDSFFLFFRYWKNYIWMLRYVCSDGKGNGHFNLFCTYIGKFFYVKSLVACCWPHTLRLGSFDLRGQLFGVLHQFAQCCKIRGKYAKNHFDEKSCFVHTCPQIAVGYRCWTQGLTDIGSKYHHGSLIFGENEKHFSGSFSKLFLI